MSRGAINKQYQPPACGKPPDFVRQFGSSDRAKNTIKNQMDKKVVPLRRKFNCTIV